MDNDVSLPRPAARPSAHRPRRRARATAYLLLCAAVLTGCSSNAPRPVGVSRSSSPAVASRLTAAAAAVADGQSCSLAGPLDATVSAPLPPDLPLLAGAHLYQTKPDEFRYPVYYTWVAARPTDLLAVRDRAVAALAAAGYRLLGKDADLGVEATAGLTGPMRVNLQVIQLCQGRLRLRYTPLRPH